MGSCDTQKSSTQPLSWELDLLGDTEGGASKQTNPSLTYTPGQTGHVDLVGLFQRPDGELDDLNTQNGDDMGAISPQDVHAEIWPENKRFQIPKTPATTSKKRNRDGQLMTPSLPQNPFANAGNQDAGVMSLTQVFGATQAPSSPSRHALAGIPSVLNSDWP